MLKLSILELIFRAIPEGILHIMAVYIFSHEKIDLRKIFTSGCLLAVIIFFIRILPIQFGVYTLIFLVALIFTATRFNKLDTNKAISSSFISMIVLSICDWISFFIMIDILKSNVKAIMNDPVLKILYGLPSLAIYIFVIFICYKVIYKNRKVLKNVSS